MAEKHFAVKLKRSAAGWPETQVRTLESLGLSRFGRTIYLKDTPAVRGMLYKVVHVVDVTAHQGPPPPSKRAQMRAKKKTGGKKTAAKKTQKSAES